MSEQPPSATTEPVPEPEPDAPAQAAPAGSTIGDTLRWLAVAACVGASVIHFAYAPTHLDEETSHGVFFLAVAWAQLGAGFALARWRDVRWPWTAAAALQAAVVAVWVVSRTAGVPGSDAESVAFPDALATGLEVVTLLAAAVALRPALATRPVARLHPALGGVAALALIGVVSASVTPSMAGEHEHGSGHEEAAGHHDGGAGHEEVAGHDGGGHPHGEPQAVADVDRDDRCDLGFNTEAFNEVSVPGMPHAHDDTEPVDFTLDEWAEVFVDPDNGIPPAVVADYIEERPTLRDGILTGGITHTLEPDPWNPMTDPDECEALAGELADAKEVAATYPTIADAEAAGYQKVTTYYPGIAAHYMNFDYVDGTFELDKPEMLLYDGDGPTAAVVGLSYYIVREGDEEPEEGFTGDNDHYHRHVGLCIKDGVVAAGSGTSEEDCSALGGRKSDGTAGWMSHVWIAPGCESDWGVFSGANPALKVRGLDTEAPTEPGCGTGKTIDDDLAFEGGPAAPRSEAG